MGLADWDIDIGGDAAVGHSAWQHILVPDQQLTHDSWARKLDNVGGADHGRAQILYGTAAPDYSQLDLVSDLSIRGAFCMGLRGGTSSLVLGLRMSAGAPTATTDKKMISDDGYQLILYENGSTWRYALERYDSGVATSLATDILASGAADQYKWFHLRMDMLLQPNGDATLQVFQNDLVTNPINPSNPPTWGTSWTKIDEVYDPSANVPAYSRAGWGGQVGPGAGSVYETYTDWVEIWYS
jgi:hypothetical protein